MVGFCCLLVFAACASAATPEASLQQYLARQWSAADGLNDHRINAIVQTPDGYLWVGTDNDLLRFDGFTFQSIQPPPDSVVVPIRHVLNLTVDRDGVLWIQTEDARLLRYDHGAFEQVFSIESHEAAVTAIAPARDHGIIADGLNNGLVHVTASGVQHLTLESVALVIALAHAPDGGIWIGTREEGVMVWKDGAVANILQGLPDTKINCLLPGDDGKVWIGTDNGLAMWDGHAVVHPKLPADMEHVQILALVQDHERNLWIGTARGLIRLDSSGAQWSPHELDNAVTALTEDRQGDIWFGNGANLERLRKTPITVYGDVGQAAGGQLGPVFADIHGRTWFAPLAGGLYWVRDGLVHPVTQAGLEKDVVYSIDGVGDDIWLGRQNGGLTRLHLSGDSITARNWTTRDGLAQNSVYAVRAVRDGSIWAGTLIGGLSHLANGRLTTFTTADGLVSNTITAIEEDGLGEILCATPEGLCIFDGAAWHTRTMQSGLPSLEITALLAVPATARDVWIGTANGLAYAANGTARTVNVPGLSGTVRALAFDGEGVLWIATKTQLLSVAPSLLVQNKARPEDVSNYSVLDGLRSTDGEARARAAVTATDGRVWIGTSGGLAVTSPASAFQARPAIAHIESVAADGRPLPFAEDTQVPAGTHRIALSFTGIYLREPERIRFRYFLENFDRGWSAPTAEREAVYTNLSPGQYRFHVIASNSDGTWTGPEVVEQITLRPLLWQRWEFKLACFAVLFLIGVWIYHARIQFLISQANMRSEERLIERTAIARELHDTLLQSFHALILFFQMGVDQMGRSDPARKSLEEALSHSDQVMREGRERLVTLRASMAAPELNAIFTATGEELQALYDSGFEVIVEGEPRSMQAIAQEELAYIGREAIGNAFRHAYAKNILVRLCYDLDRFRMEVLDNGKGIPANILRAGKREGHWGLTGMRERARKIGAHFDMGLRSGGGTEISVSIDAALIYDPGPSVSDHPFRAAWLAVYRSLRVFLTGFEPPRR